MIPKRIFYVWGAGEELKRDAQICIQTWRQAMPDFEVIEINENSKLFFDFEKEINDNEWFREVYNRRMFAYIADYVRLKVLYDHGGVYLDTDVSAIKTLKPFLSNLAFVGMQSAGLGKSYTEPAILGAEAGNQFLKRVIEFYQKDIWDEEIYTLPQVFNKILNEEYGEIVFPDKDKQEIITLTSITIYPEKYFIPFRFGTKFSPSCVEEDTHTIHWFSGSWCRPEIEFFLKNKHLTKKPILFSRKSFSLIGLQLVEIISSKMSFKIILFKMFRLIEINQHKESLYTNKIIVNIFGFSVASISIRRWF